MYTISTSSLTIGSETKEVPTSKTKYEQKWRPNEKQNTKAEKKNCIEAQQRTSMKA